MGSGENQFSLCILSGSNTFFFSSLNTMIHTVSDDVHQGILQTVYNGFVYFRILADNSKLYVFSELLLHIADDTIHFLEYAGNGDHSKTHGDVLQIIGKLSKLSCGFHEVIQTFLRKHTKNRRGSNHRFCDYNFSHEVI